MNRLVKKISVKICLTGCHSHKFNGTLRVQRDNVEFKKLFQKICPQQALLLSIEISKENQLHLYFHLWFWGKAANIRSFRRLWAEAERLDSSRRERILSAMSSASSQLSWSRQLQTVFNSTQPHLGCGSELARRLESGKTHGSKVRDADHRSGNDGRGRDDGSFGVRLDTSGMRKGEGR